MSPINILLKKIGPNFNIDFSKHFLIKIVLIKVYSHFSLDFANTEYVKKSHVLPPKYFTLILIQSVLYGIPKAGSVDLRYNHDTLTTSHPQ